MKIAIVFGTRPEIIKAGPIIKLLKKSEYSLIFTSQHYDYNMSVNFINELKLPQPNFKFKLSTVSNSTTDRATQTGEIIQKLAKIITKIKPDGVLVIGDTNTVLASSITSIKCGIPIVHVESGLRSHDWRMPEEHNRIAVDHISEILTAPTKMSMQNLKNENVHGHIYVTGNTSIDSIMQNLPIAKKNSKIEIPDDDFALVTFHRGENVDNPKSLSGIIKALINSKTKMIIPVHPRTRKKLHEFGFLSKLENTSHLTLINPVGYFDMLLLMKKSSFIISDSGGIQEEATALPIRKKVIVIRKTTDRPESVLHGYSIVTGTNTSKILSEIKKVSQNPIINSRKNPYGKGNAGEKIASILKKHF